MNENLKPKPTITDKIDNLLSKMPIGEQLDTWKEIGERIHNRITNEQEKRQQEIQNLEGLKSEIK